MDYMVFVLWVYNHTYIILLYSRNCIGAFHIQSLLYSLQEALLDDLDPLTDSFELEFGMDTTDGQKGLRHRSRPARQQMPHPLAQYSASAPMTGYTPLPQDDIGRRSPPPSYDVAVVQGTPDTYGTSHLYPGLSEDPYSQQTVPRSSSTPSVDGRQ